MQFVKVENLKVGMRLARPIYNRQGVLLFERDSRLTEQGIASIANFGLLGLFILEPAEPVPPMTQEDLEFERFQTMVVYSIQEELEHILNVKKTAKLESIAGNIIRHYGHLEKKINFIQNLRSREDYIYKHALNVAILCAMITHVMNVKLDEQLATILAALMHDIGKLSLSLDIREQGASTPESVLMIRNAETGAYDLIESVVPEGTVVRRICMQSQKALEDMREQRTSSMKMVIGAKILVVADTYDMLTAMKLNGTPMSEVAAMRYLTDNPETFDKDVVNALLKSINILIPGSSVELNTGEKALVIRENENDVLRPVVLSFADNSIIDLGDRKLYGDIMVTDIMKTLDNRCVFDTESLKRAGIKIEGPKFI